ncbi:hypothetical protein Vafri_17101 [Volvox africanus]|uniref:Pherophorin domain-containing protein n=1 Tax=Volvox africanus TaxID=51714 RepID=A0A8J4BK10_9CHLO|nr:hypothetical protein Vafri_17101 [Volvox africanus]
MSGATKMNRAGVVAVLAAAAFMAVANAQSGLYPNFPFCQCTKSPAAYSLSPTVKSTGRGKYCFTLNVNPPPGCNTFCCKADFRKLEFNVNPECDVSGAVVKSFVNGVPTTVGPAFDEPYQGPVGAKILRFTQLGLGLGDDNAEICISLAPNKFGEGCTTLEALCVPPKGMAPGVCSAAMFDSSMGCCPISNVNVPSPPPPPPPSPPPPPPPRPPPPSPPPPPPPSPPPPSPPPPSPPPPPPPSPPPPSPPPPSPPPPSPPPPSPPPPPPPSPPPPPPPSPPPPAPTIAAAASPAVSASPVASATIAATASAAIASAAAATISSPTVTSTAIATTAASTFPPPPPPPPTISPASSSPISSPPTAAQPAPSKPPT